MLDLSHGSGAAPGRMTPPKNLDLSLAITDEIDRGIERAEAYVSSGKRRIGASSLGHPCLRHLVYKYLRTPGTPPAGQIRRIWARGHAAEARIIGWLRDAGFTVIDRDPRDAKQQIGFSQAQGRIAGRIDGVIISGPLALPYPVMLELKCLNRKSWNDLVKHGLTSSEVYNAQTHLYLAYLDLKHCLFGAECADTMELWWQLVPLDIVEAQRVSDKGVQVVTMGDAGELPPRVAAAKDYYLCRICEHSDICWGEI